jgi:hypothetical protein
MSRSPIERNRFQSALETLEEDLCFTSGCFTERDNVDFMFGLGVYDGYAKSSQQSKTYEPLLTVIESVILEGDRRSGKDFLCIYKVEPGLRTFALRFDSFQVNCTVELYIHRDYYASAVLRAGLGVGVTRIELAPAEDVAHPVDHPVVREIAIEQRPTPGLDRVSRPEVPELSRPDGLLPVVGVALVTPHQLPVDHLAEQV